MTDQSIPYIIIELEKNIKIYTPLLDCRDDKLIYWKPSKNKWCLLELVCHLIDEEVEDFRSRVKHTLQTPDLAAPPIDPVGWVKSRSYIDQDFQMKVSQFLEERVQSIKYLKSLQNPKWTNEYSHSQIGNISAKQFLVNWLAHDLLHMRQIIKLKFQYLQYTSNQDLRYAGEL